MEALTNIEGINITTLFYLNRIISLCKKNNINILFLSIPSPSTWNYERHNAVDYLTKNNNAPYVDLNEMISDLGINLSTETRDGIHLNYYGAYKVSKFVGNYLNQNYQFSDHRNDESYHTWNQDLQTYESIINS